MSNIQASGILEYGLKDILVSESVLALNVDEQIVTLLRSGHIVKQVTLTGSQQMLLLPLLNGYPKHVPYSEMLSIYTNHSVGACESLIEDDAAVALRPVRDVLSRLNEKLELLGITVAVVMDNGFILLSYHEKGR